MLYCKEYKFIYPQIVTQLTLANFLAGSQDNILSLLSSRKKIPVSWEWQRKTVPSSINGLFPSGFKVL